MSRSGTWSKIQDDGELRQCNRCLEWKEREKHFYKHKRCKLGFSSWCISCHKIVQTEQDLKKKYNGFTPEQLEDLLVKQNSCCAVCGRKLERAKLHIDHSHVTKKVRGLLCFKCNVGIGYFQESLEILESAIKYLSQENGTEK